MSIEDRNSYPPRHKSVSEVPVSIETPKSLQAVGNKSIEFFTKSFTVIGKENLDEVQAVRERTPNSKFVIATSHLSNLDVPAAIKAFGKEFNLQISATSQNFGLTHQEAMFRIAGKDNFTPLTHTKKTSTNESRGVFDPKDFTDLVLKTENGKTPWIAAHEFSVSGEMQRAKIGSIYLAQKTDSYILPAALEMKGGASMSLEKPTDVIRGAFNKAEAVYHIGKPFKPEPIDVSIIENVIEKRKQGVKPTPEEREQFSTAVALLRQQAEKLGEIIASLLPEEMRGVYKTENAD